VTSHEQLVARSFLEAPTERHQSHSESQFAFPEISPPFLARISHQLFSTGAEGVVNGDCHLALTWQFQKIACG
jgi:hypothetical protein